MKTATATCTVSHGINSNYVWAKRAKAATMRLVQQLYAYTYERIKARQIECVRMKGVKDSP